MEIEKNRSIIQTYNSINEPLIDENRYYDGEHLSEIGEAEDIFSEVDHKKQKISKGMIYAFCTTIFLVAIAFFLKLVYKQQAEL